MIWGTDSLSTREIFDALSIRMFGVRENLRDIRLILRENI